MISFRRVCALTAAAIAMLVLVACEGQTNPATEVTETSAKLNGAGRCTQEEHGDFFFQYKRMGTSTWIDAPRHRFDCTGPTSAIQLSDTINGLTPATTYEFRIAVDFDGVGTNLDGWVDANGAPSGSDYDALTTESTLDGSPPGWSKWATLGGILTSGPSVSSWGEGRLDLFVRNTTNSVSHRAWDTGGGGWAPWDAVTAGTLRGDPAAVSWGPGRIDQFERGEDDMLYHRACCSASGWSERYSLGGILTSEPAVSSFEPGRLDVFARNNSNLISQRTYVNGAWQGWDTVGAGEVTSKPAAVSWGPNRIDLFARGPNNDLLHRWCDPCPQSGWSQWESLGGILTSAPAVSSWGPGRLDVFVRNTSNLISHRAFDYATGGWQPWETLAGTVTSSPAAVSWSPGRIDLFARGPNDELRQMTYATDMDDTGGELGPAEQGTPSGPTEFELEFPYFPEGTTTAQVREERFRTRGDRVHLSSDPTPKVSAHGWWEWRSGPAWIAKVTVKIQQHWGGRWENVGNPGQKNVLAGGGSANRATAKVSCTPHAGATYTYRSVVDVDIIGYKDAPNKLKTSPEELDCTVK